MSSAQRVKNSRKRKAKAEKYCQRRKRQKQNSLLTRETILQNIVQFREFPEDIELLHGKL